MFDSAFPDGVDHPSKIAQSDLLETVASDIVLELGQPIVSILLGHREITVGTAMPEAPVHEDGDPATGVRDVRAAHHLALCILDLPLQAISRMT